MPKQSFEVITLSDFQPTPYGKGGEPWCMAYVYCRDGRRFLVKGMSRDVGSHYVNKQFPKALVRYTFWDKGKSRGWWEFTCRSHSVCRRGRRWEVEVRGDTRKTLSFRRLPHKWIPEFNA